MSAVEIMQIIISILSLIATIVVSFLIYWLQRRHEIEMLKIEDKHAKELLEEKAHTFLIDNEEERDYLPWCIVSANLHKHSKHIRKIYTNFNRCPQTLQNEILRQAGFTLTVITETEWDSKCFDKLETDIDKYFLGKQKFLYDGAKYFHRGFERYKEQSVILETDKLYERICTSVSTDKNDLCSFRTYIEQYFDYILDKKSKETINNKEPYPPIDYVWDYQKLGCAKEDVVCYWVMDIVENIVINIHNRFCGNFFESEINENMTDAQVETFEDKYYHALYWLYFTYYKNSIKA